MSQSPSSVIRCIEGFVECSFEKLCNIETAVDAILVAVTPEVFVSNTVTEFGVGAGSVLAGYISATLINQGDTNVTVNGATLFPGTTITFGLKGLTGPSALLSFTVAAGTTPSLLVLDVR